MVTWLDLAGTGTARADLDAAAAFLDRYQAVRPLSAAEAEALPDVLPVVHVEYALSELDYFTTITRSAANADLAYEYLIGHARWFGGPQGAALLEFLRQYFNRYLGRAQERSAGR
jgi:Ser/Thr protein kinase RdoA (MazF antagonist)